MRARSRPDRRTTARCSLACAIAVILTSCAPLKDLEFTGLKGFRVDEIGTKGIKGDVMVSIRNPNPFGFTIYRSAFDVTYAGVKLGTATLSKKVRIKAREERDYAFRLESDFGSATLSDVMKVLNSASRRERLDVKGDLRAGRLFVRRKFPVALSEPVHLK